LKSVYTITPSWLIKKKKDLTDGIATLRKLGFDVRNPSFVTRLPSPREKARQIHDAFKNPGIDLILAQRGGYSSMQSLPYIDFSVVRKHPKLFAGFSDLSTYLNLFYERAGLITLHAPMVINMTNPTRFTVRSFRNAINGFPEKDLFKGAPVKAYRHGTASGILKGGNLITITALIGTPWDISTDDCIVFLEDVDEELHEVDRYLTQWILAGKFKKVKGIILGDFRGIKNTDVYRILRSQMKIKIPVVCCPYIGHVKNKITLPVGAKVTLNTRQKSLTIE
jgi:muramoyltetrapeptide carboxypeptidase